MTATPLKDRLALATLAAPSWPASLPLPRWLAAVPALAGPIVIEPDPIYAAIEAHRAAWAELESKTSALDAAHTEEAEAELRHLIDTEEDAANEVAMSIPTTLAGALSLSRYAAELDRR